MWLSLTGLFHRRHVYPTYKGLPDPSQSSRIRSFQEFVEEIKKRLAPVINVLDINAGDIVDRIATDLASPAAEHELRLLPLVYEYLSMSLDIVPVWDSAICL